jgi:hypothetical protein
MSGALDSEGGKVLDFADGCHVWCHINGGQAASGAQVAAVSRSADNSDLVIIRMNNCVHTARCGQCADGWHGWWADGFVARTLRPQQQRGP